MTRYGEDLAELAGAAAALVAAGPRQPPLRDPQLAAGTLAARDTVLSAVRGTYVEISGTGWQGAGPAAPGAPAPPESHPARALTAALHTLEPAARDVAPSAVDALRHDPDPVSGHWLAAAGAALNLERRRGHWTGLQPAATWAAVADLAQLAAALPYLDGDLARRLPASAQDAVRALGDPVTHARTRIAATELLWLSRSGVLDFAATGQELPTTPRLVVLRGPEQLDEGLRGLAAILTASRSIAPADVFASAAGLERVAAAAGGTLRAAGPHITAAAAAGQALHDIRGPLRDLAVRRTAVAGLLRPLPVVNAQCREIAVAADKLAGRLPGGIADPADLTHRQQLRELAGIAVAAAEQLPAAADALAAAATRTALAGDFLVPNHEPTTRTARVAWLPSTPSREDPGLAKLLTAAAAAAEAAQSAPGPVAAVRAGLGAPFAARRAAAAAGRALTGLGEAISSRPIPPTAPAQPTHPQQRPWRTR